MRPPIRLTAVLTHPVQYYAPWFRHIAAHCPEIDLTVLYATRPTPAQQGVGFGTDFEWDPPLTSGYRCRVVRRARPGDSVHSGHFWGLDVPEIGAAIVESRPDVALIPGWHSVTLLRALGACRRARVPVLYRGDTHLGNAPSGWRRSVWALRTRWLLRRFDGYLSPGQRVRAYLERFGVDPGRVFDVPHCVDNELFAGSAARFEAPGPRADARISLGLDPRDFVVLFAGKLEAKKRPSDLIRAMARLAPGASLLVAGSGELEPACREEAARLGVTAVWAGFVNQSQLGRIYAVSDCLVLPSDWGETWGLVVNEALATGLPCVVSDRVGAAPDLVVPGASGDIFPMADIAALAAALERLRAHPPQEGERTLSGRKWVAGHSVERATAGLVAACRAAARRPERVSEVRERAVPSVVACCGAMVTVSGLERMAFEVLSVLREHGARVHCIVNGWDNHRIVARAEQIGASWSTGSYRHRLSRRTRNPVTMARLAWDVVRTSAGLVNDAMRRSATHVLVPEYTTALRNLPALIFLRLTGCRVIACVQNAPAPGRFYRRLWRWAVSPLADHFVCCSEHANRELLAHGVPAAKMSIIRNVAPGRAATADRRVAHDPRTIVYVGQIIPEKGLDLLLDAAGLLVSRGRDARVVVVGAMDAWVAPDYVGYRERLLRRAKDPDLAGRVDFLGWREDVPAILAAAGVHCCPSRPEMLEGLPLVCLEAKEAGVPSVVFPGGPFPEIIGHRVDGWICREASAEALAEGVEYFIADPARRERAGEAARASAARFGRAQFAEAWWRAFTTP